MAMAYSVRQSEALPVADTLMGLWRRNLGIRPDIDLSARLRWYYLDGPEGPGRVMLLVASGPEGETVVGCEGIGVRRFAVAGQPGPVRAGLLGDLAVERSHRTLMPALSLVRASRNVARELAMHYGFPNAAAAPLFERIGYRTLGTLTRWVRVIRHAGYIERVQQEMIRGGVLWSGVLINRMVARASGALLDGVRLAQAAVVKAARGQLVLEPLADADQRLDRLWDAGHGQWRVIAWRGAAFLRWRFLRLPGTRCELVALSEPRTRAVRAYAVLDPIDSVVHLRDFFGVSLRDLGRLFDLLVPFLYRRGATAISLSFLGSPQVEAMLRAHHFFAWKSTRQVVVDTPPGAATPESEDWYLTDADEDT